MTSLKSRSTSPCPQIIFLCTTQTNEVDTCEVFKLEDFMIYRLVMKRLKFQHHHQQPPIARFCNQFNHAFEMLIFMPRFKSISFNQNRPKKITLFCKKKKNCQVSKRLGLRPQPPCLRRLRALPPASQPPAPRGYTRLPLIEHKVTQNYSNSVKVVI